MNCFENFPVMKNLKKYITGGIMDKPAKKKVRTELKFQATRYKR